MATATEWFEKASKESNYWLKSVVDNKRTLVSNDNEKTTVFNDYSWLDILPVSPLRRQSIDVFTPVLAHMANLSFIRCNFPEAFKTTQVTPVLKKSALESRQKLHVQLPTDIEPFNGIQGDLTIAGWSLTLRAQAASAPSASLYRSGHSTEMALLHVMNQLYSALMKSMLQRWSLSTFQWPSTPSTKTCWSIPSPPLDLQFATSGFVTRCPGVCVCDHT